MTRLAVVGSINLDLVVNVDRLPAPGETVLGADAVHRPGGKGANQAVAALRFGADAALFGALGDDAFGGQLRAGLTDRGLPGATVHVDPQRPSGLALIVVEASGENTITVAPGANAGLTVESMADLEGFLDTADGLLVQLEIPIGTALAAARAARERGVPVIVNVSPVPPGAPADLTDLIACTDVLVVNETEALALDASGADWPERARSLLGRGPGLVVITLGRDGAVAAAAAELIEQAAFPVTMVDATGAGDAFCGVFAVEFARGCPLATALEWACAAGAIATTRLGAQDAAPDRTEIENFIELRRN